MTSASVCKSADFHGVCVQNCVLDRKSCRYLCCIPCRVEGDRTPKPFLILTQISISLFPEAYYVNNLHVNLEPLYIL